MQYLIGIDPGVKTGYAIKDLVSNKIIESGEKTIIEAFEMVKNYSTEQLVVICEDSNKWNGRGLSSIEKMARSQGAGSSKRESNIWREFLKHHGYLYKMVPPSHKNKGGYFQKSNKITHKEMVRYAGVNIKRSNQHQRDAIMHICDYSLRDIQIMQLKQPQYETKS